MIVEVAVDKVKYGFDSLYSYKVPADLEEKIFLGVRVLVPFGNSKSKRLAVVLKKSQTSDVEVSDLNKKGIKNSNLKEVCIVIDDSPVVTDEMIFLAKYMKKNYYCTLFTGIKAMLPVYKGLTTKNFFEADEEKFNFLKKNLNLKEIGVIKFILQNKDILRGKKCEKFESENKSVIDKLVNLGILKFNYIKETKSIRKYDEPIKLNEYVSSSLTEKQKKVVDFFIKQGESTIKEVCYFTGVSRNLVNNLLKKGILKYFSHDKKSENIFETNSNFTENKKTIKLTELQNKVYNELEKLAKKNEMHISLVRGVTGSGKTMVLLSLIDFVLKKGQSVIFMVPEIALTTQIISIFKSRYKEDAAVIHSKLSDKKRREEWQRISKGNAKVVVGTRTAVFAPVKNLGLIIMDEEHETSYKSEASPRFHARDLAIQRCKYNKCMLVLTSATPSVESYFWAKSGIYSLHTLDKRYGKAILPEVEIIDMNSEIMKGNPTPFSERLVEVIKDEIDKGKQSILLLNRRGYHTFVRCKDCRESVICPNCNITLNYHRANERLMCHYCGYSMDFLKECPKCHGVNIAYEGIGTQRAEFQLQMLIPDAKILRMDTDAITSENSLEESFKKFSEGTYNVMIGTQMIAKGFNFPNVTLVGVLMADQALYCDDFRSYERAFSLITQVIGRAGRGEYMGKAIIQTYTPENSVISLAAKQDYEAFYNDEIEIRKTMLYPPFSDICCVGFTGKDEKKVAEISIEFFEKLKKIAFEEYKDIPLRIFKPSPANINKICGNYRYRILIKCRNGKKFHGMMSKIMISYESKANLKKVNIFIDMNPSFII